MNRVAWVVLVVPALAVAAPSAQKPEPSKLAAKPKVVAKKPSPLVAKAKVVRQREIDSSSLTPSAVAKRIESSYLAGVEACFQSRIDAGVRSGGTVDLAFVVTQDGKTSKPLVKSFDDALTACVTSKVATWTFGKPTRFGKPASSGFELQLTLEARGAAKDRAAELAIDQAEAQRIADAFSATFSSDDGNTLAGSLRRPGADLGNLDTAASDSLSLGKGGGAGMAALGPGSAQPSTGGSAGSKPQGRVTFSGKRAIDDTTLTVDAVAAKVTTTYLAGIKRCYKRRLDVEPSARGTLHLGFSVSEVGRTDATSAKGGGIDESVGTCVETQMATWRFPIPKSAGGKPTTAEFEIDLALAPD